MPVRDTLWIISDYVVYKCSEVLGHPCGLIHHLLEAKYAKNGLVLFC